MGYQKIQNLYKDKDILLVKRIYAMEKIHGSSAHIAFNATEAGGAGSLHFYAGGCKHDSFVALFNQEAILAKMVAACPFPNAKVVVFGEVYGGKMQGMRETYGDQLRFIAFEVKIGDTWLCVPAAEKFVLNLGLEFVHYKEIDSTVAAIDAERDADSVQAVRNLNKPGMRREGVVLRPLEELTKNNGHRIMAKHIHPDFRENKTERKVDDPEKMRQFQEASAVVDEFCTPMRLTHVLSKIPDHCVEKMKIIIDAMVEDINTECADEFTPSANINRLIGTKTAKMYKALLNSSI